MSGLDVFRAIADVAGLSAADGNALYAITSYLVTAKELGRDLRIVLETWRGAPELTVTDIETGKEAFAMAFAPDGRPLLVAGSEE
jgi:hypothetical protein